MHGVTVFLIALFNDPLSFLGALLFSGVLVFLVFRKYVYAWFDPLVYLALNWVFIIGDMIFMFRQELISSFYFYHFLLSQGMFFFGFLLIRPINMEGVSSLRINFQNQDRLLDLLFYFSVFIYFSAQLFTYFFLGVPIFAEARLQTYQVGGGVGLLGRLAWVFSKIIIFLLLDRFFRRQMRLGARFLDGIVFLTLIGTFFLGGAKGALLILVFVVFYYYLFMLLFNFNIDRSKLQRLLRYQLILLFLAVVAAFGVASFELNRMGVGGGRLSPIVALGQRLVRSGDVFMMGYIDEVVENMQQDNGFMAMFSDFFGMFRLVSYDDLPVSLGNQLHRYHAKNNLPMGPNPLHNIFGLFYFGYWGSLLYSFLVGYVFSYLRNRLIFHLPRSYLGAMFFMLLLTSVSGIMSDVTIALSYLNSALFLGLPVLFFVFIIYAGAKQHKLRKVQGQG